MDTRILYTKPSITDLEIRYATDAVTHGWGDRCYDYIHRFEESFKQHLDVKYAVATSSCTGALHMGMAALGIGPGDEVIIADTNWIASAAPITYLGATPVFVDVLADSWCINPRQIEAAITSRTKAIVAVHLYGNLCEMDTILEIANKYGLPVIEDAAEAIGSQYGGKKAGSIGAFGAFSFHGTKTLTTGEGGIFVTNDPSLYDKFVTLSNHGRARYQTKQFWPDMLGFKYKMSNVQAAIGCAQLERIEELIARKREVMQYYRDGFAHLSSVSLNPEPSGTINGAWMPTAVFSTESGLTCADLQRDFSQKNIDARVFFSPLSSLPMFEPKPTNENSWSIPKRAINLPSFHEITNEQQNRVIGVILNALAR